MDAGEGGRVDREVGIARAVHLGVNVVRQMEIGVEGGVRVVAENRDRV